MSSDEVALSSLVDDFDGELEVGFETDGRGHNDKEAGAVGSHANARDALVVMVWESLGLALGGFGFGSLAPIPL
jgi:hypothetical protein